MLMVMSLFMFIQRVHATCPCSIFMYCSIFLQQGDMDLKHGQSSWTCSMGIQDRHAAWTCTIDQQHGHGRTACTWSIDMKYGHRHAEWNGAWTLTCSIDMDMHDGHGNAVWTFTSSIDMGIQ